MSDCICEGNWRKIISESEDCFGKTVTFEGKTYTFMGVLHGEDDYYYVLSDCNSKCHFFSCVGNFKSWDIEISNG